MSTRHIVQTPQVTRLLTQEEAAQRLGLTNPATLAVWRSTRRYDIKFHKIGRLVRYDEREIERFIASRMVGGA